MSVKFVSAILGPEVMRMMMAGVVAQCQRSSKLVNFCTRELLARHSGNDLKKFCLLRCNSVNHQNVDMLWGHQGIALYGPIRSRLKLSENFERHWSIPILGEVHMDQSLVHTFSWGNSYGPMVLKVLQKFPLTLALVHGWLFPEYTHDL